MSYFDALGEWESLGLLTAQLEWQQFPQAIVQDPQTLLSETFKLTFDCLWENRTRRYSSYGLIRFDFANGSIAGPFRIYPNPETKMTTFPIPIEILEIAGLEYHASVRKVVKHSYGEGLPEVDPPWSLTLDYFVSPAF